VLEIFGRDDEVKSGVRKLQVVSIHYVENGTSVAFGSLDGGFGNINPDNRSRRLGKIIGAIASPTADIQNMLSSHKLSCEFVYLEMVNEVFSREIGVDAFGSFDIPSPEKVNNLL
jgi:hypothetical protein